MTTQTNQERTGHGPQPDSHSGPDDAPLDPSVPRSWRERIGRTWVGTNFFVALLLGLAAFVYVITVTLNEPDPAIARANRAGLGAAALALVEIALLALYLRRGVLSGLVRTFAGIIGFVGLLQNSVVPLVLRELYDQVFPTNLNMVMWYVYGSHLLYALIGDADHRSSHR